MENETPTRRVVQLEDNKWTGYFIDSPPLPCSLKPKALFKARRDELVSTVCCMLERFKEDLSQGMKVVDSLERLGVGYHFKDEIDKFMGILNVTPVGEDDDLARAALRFRLLRQHRYNVPCEFIEMIMDENGCFKDALRHDVDVLLSLYEASHLGKCGEDSLSRAIVFTTNCLSAMAEGGELTEHSMAKIQHALVSPSQRRVKRLEAKLYISIYENDEESNKDILELAKLDFHILQQMHRDEVKSISQWYKDLNHGSILGEYIRERSVECYFWALGVFDEPEYVKARMMLARFIKAIALFDDTYDSYGTLEELRQFNQAVQSWDEEGAKRVGKCFGYIMSLLSKTLEECLADGASPLGIDCTKQAIKEVSKCMLQEVTWREEGEVPSVQDHLKVTTISTFYWALSCMSFAGMRPTDDHIFSEWAISLPTIIQNASMVSRLMDDISGHECGKERSNVPTAVDCYVREHGVTVQEAKQALSCLVEEQWRSINGEFLGNTAIPASLLTRVINLARVMESLYKKVDGYTHCSGIAHSIEAVLDKCVQH